MTKEEIIAELKEMIPLDEEDTDPYLIIWDIERLISRLEKEEK